MFLWVHEAALLLHDDEEAQYAPAVTPLLTADSVYFLKSPLGGVLSIRSICTSVQQTLTKGHEGDSKDVLHWRRY